MHRVLQPSDTGRDHGRAGGERLHGNESKALVVGGDHADIGRVVVVRQILARDRADKAHPVGDPQLVCQGVELGHGLRCRFAIASRDDQPDRLVEFRRRDGADQDVDALERLQPAHEQGDRATGQAQAGASPGLVAGSEADQVDPRRHDRNAVALRAVKLNQEITLVGSRADQPVGCCDDAPFRLNAGRRLVLRPAGAVLDLTQGVEHGDVRHVPAIGQIDAD